MLLFQDGVGSLVCGWTPDALVADMGQMLIDGWTSLEVNPVWVDPDEGGGQSSLTHFKSSTVIDRHLSLDPSYRARGVESIRGNSVCLYVIT